MTKTREQDLERVRWDAVLARDRTQDSRFVYAVVSTGIYCRPSCPARKPKRANVRFFPLPALAEEAGYRACRRCSPRQEDPQLEKIRALCRYIEQHRHDPLTLEHLGAVFGLSPSHLQRSFKRLVGVTPQAYLESCRMTAFKEALRAGDAIGGALYEAGYGSSSRLYSKTDAQLGMTPQTYRQKGQGAYVRYTVVDTALGQVLVAATEKGICSVRLAGSEAELEAELHEEFAQADLCRDDAALADWVGTITRHLAGQEPRLELPLDVRATAFQKQVWQALQAIPYGETRSYAQVAEAIGKPSAVRAVAQACAKNPVALIVPCHRVVRSDGSLSGYRWGAERKRALLEQEKNG